MMPIYIYVLEGERGCKIGISENPRQRSRNIATQGGLVLLRLCTALPVLNHIAREVEREAHQRLAAYRSVGEWFAVDHMAASATVEAAIIAVTKRYVLTDQGGNLLPPIIDQRRNSPSVPDAIDRFIRDRIEPCDGARVQARVLYTAFVEWCLLAGEEPLTETAFGRAAKLRIKRHRLGQLRSYFDVRIREGLSP